MNQALEGIRVIDFAQPIVAVAVAEDPACVDMVDGHLIENRHVDDARRVLAWADANRQACDAPIDPTEASPWRD